MKYLHKIRDGFWINPAHVTNAWVSEANPFAVSFQLSSDGSDNAFNTLNHPLEVAIFCRITGFEMPAPNNQPKP